MNIINHLLWECYYYYCYYFTYLSDTMLLLKDNRMNISYYKYYIASISKINQFDK